MTIIYGHGREAVPCGQRPADPIRLDVLRRWLSHYGTSKQVVTLIAVDGGFHFHVHPDYGYKKSDLLHSEKTGQPRLFKTAEAAFNLARSLGFSKVEVEL